MVWLQDLARKFGNHKGACIAIITSTLAPAVVNVLPNSWLPLETNLLGKDGIFEIRFITLQNSVVRPHHFQIYGFVPLLLQKACIPP